jgi:hypothetical protein
MPSMPLVFDEIAVLPTLDDWTQTTDTLNRQGSAVLPQLLSARECKAVAGCMPTRAISAAAW